MLASQHLYDQAANAPYIRLAGVGSLLNDLWRHPEDGTLQRHAIGPGKPWIGYQHASPAQTPQKKRAFFNLFGNTEIGNLDAAFIVHKNVGTFDVPMYDGLPMQIFQSTEYLPHPICGERLLESAVIP